MRKLPGAGEKRNVCQGEYANHLEQERGSDQAELRSKLEFSVEMVRDQRDYRLAVASTDATVEKEAATVLSKYFEMSKQGLLPMLTSGVIYVVKGEDWFLSGEYLKNKDRVSGVAIHSGVVKVGDPWEVATAEVRTTRTSAVELSNWAKQCWR